MVAGRSSCLALGAHHANGVSAGKALGVSYVLQGSVRSDAERYRFTAELVDAETDRVCWSERFDGRLADVLGIEASIVHAVAATLAFANQTS